MVIGESIGTTDVAIIGAGPGGYTAAIRLAELGKKVTIVDRESTGGVCLHHGCIPTKALIHAAELYQEFNRAKEMGITFDNLRIDYSKTRQWKQKIVDGLDTGIKTLLKHHKINLIKANAFFESSNKVALRNESEHLDINALEFKKCIIAIGSKEREITGVKIDGTRIITSNEALELDTLPSSLLIIGGGYIGIEISQMMAKFGVNVIIVEALPTILNLLDEEFSALVAKQLKKFGAEIYCNAKVESSIAGNNSVKTIVNTPEGKKEFQTEKVLVAVGRVPSTQDLELDNTKVELDVKGFIKVDEKFQTADSRIHAIGDVIGGVMLAHKASFEAKIVAEIIAGKRSAFDNFIPYAIFSDPEIAGVGLSEKEAKQKGIKYDIKTFNSATLAKVKILGGEGCIFKVLFDENKNILGVHIAGPRSADIIGEAVLAIEMGATLDDLALIIHPHPTVVEGYGELADAATGFPTNSL
ncbi:MAG: dihydrolipoyl dehydrogenase [Nanoarchaeota archaeon]